MANTVADGMKAVVVVTGYFGDRLAQIMERYGATVRRIDVEWGRAVDPARLAAELRREGADIVGVVHAETSTGVLNPVRELAAIARDTRGADDRGRGDLARRSRAGSRRLGHRRRLLLQPEVHRRAFGHVADRGVGSGTRRAW